MALLQFVEMRATIRDWLSSIERYNHEHLPEFEAYVDIQCKVKTYDMEANLNLLKLYQFKQEYNSNYVALVLLKAITNLPQRDYISCKVLLNNDLLQNDERIIEIDSWATLLDRCEFEEFWLKLADHKYNYFVVNGFVDFIRKYIGRTVAATYQTISKKMLSELMGHVDDYTVKQWINHFRWKELPDGTIYVSPKEESLANKTAQEVISLEKVASVLRIS